MFEINNEELAKKKAEHEAKVMLGKLMSKFILDSDAPEKDKLHVLALDKAQDINEVMRSLIDRYLSPQNIANVETLKKVLEYLELVEVGIKQFMDVTPFVADAKEE